VSKVVKRCQICNQEYPVDTLECKVDFSGLRYWCKECNDWSDGPICKKCTAAQSAAVEVQEAAAKPVAAKPKKAMPAWLAKADVYTVLLGVSVVAIFIAVLCLFLEWKSYNFDTHAREASLRTTIESRLA
jgi:hypothetical protein